MAKALKPITLSSRVVITDPCYTRDTWCMGVLENVKPGKYIPDIVQTDETGGWGTRVAELVVHHESEGGFISDAEWEKADFEVGVDSGQAGIFDDSIYPQGETGEYSDKKSFYGTCCEATLGEGYERFREWASNGQEGPRPEWTQGNTVFAKGVVSSSGYGDGGYECYFSKNSLNEIVAIKIVFIPDEEEEEEEDEDSNVYEFDEGEG